jgi:hypothetical protein
MLVRPVLLTLTVLAVVALLVAGVAMTTSALAGSTAAACVGEMVESRALVAGQPAVSVEKSLAAGGDGARGATRESNWDHRAENPSSGAFGIPQSLPGDKMASAGTDWRTNPLTQIEWGLGYIRDVYGSPCVAWGHSQSTGWY